MEVVLKALVVIGVSAVVAFFIVAIPFWIKEKIDDWRF